MYGSRCISNMSPEEVKSVVLKCREAWYGKG